MKNFTLLCHTMLNLIVVDLPQNVEAHIVEHKNVEPNIVIPHNIEPHIVVPHDVEPLIVVPQNVEAHIVEHNNVELPILLCNTMAYFTFSIRFSQSDVVLHLNLPNLGETKTKNGLENGW